MSPVAASHIQAAMIFCARRDESEQDDQSALSTMADLMMSPSLTMYSLPQDAVVPFLES
jgi:hypothetical protein